MLDLAISVDQDRDMTVIVETNNGKCLKAPGWPQDSDMQLVTFDPARNFCGVVVASELAADISMLLRFVKGRRPIRGRKPDWLKRLEEYSEGSQQ